MVDSISVVIPAFNEEKIIESTLGKVIRYCDSKFKEYEVIVVDDCSRDKTNKIAAGFPSSNVRVMRNETNRGKGYSVKRGVLESKYSLVLFMDCDSSLPVENLENFLLYIDMGYDVVIASRNISGAKIQNQQKHRRFYGKAFSFIASLVILRGFTDTQCGFKLFSSQSAQKIFRLQTLERFSFDVEILFIAKKKGFRIVEAPANCIYNNKSKLKPAKDGCLMLRDLLTIRLNDLRGFYKDRD